MAKLTVGVTARQDGGPGQPKSATGTVLMPAEAGQASATGRSLTGDAGAGRRDGSEQQLDAKDATQLAVDPNRRLLGGRYQIGDVLGSGGMAEVFRGRDTRLTRDVAVKVLRADLARDPSFQMRFRREAQAAASLNHPAIVAVYDTGEELSGGATIPYIVMEYVEGHTLRDVLDGEGQFSVERALGSTADVCAALEFSHRAGIIHRDIKPGNVMVTREGVVKVMDFGIARAITGSSVTMTQTAAVIGTASYLSPEQARGEHVDARSDVYSTGVLLYELLTGLPPFRGDSPVSVAYQHVKEDAPPPSSLAPGLPPAVDAIVMKALAKNVNNRYQSAAEFRDDLRRAAAGQPVLATPLLPAEAPTTVAAAPTVMGAAATVVGPAGPTSAYRGRAHRPAGHGLPGPAASGADRDGADRDAEAPAPEPDLGPGPRGAGAGRGWGVRRHPADRVADAGQNPLGHRRAERLLRDGAAADVGAEACLPADQHRRVARGGHGLLAGTRNLGRQGFDRDADVRGDAGRRARRRRPAVQRRGDPAAGQGLRSQHSGGAAINDQRWDCDLAEPRRWASGAGRKHCHYRRRADRRPHDTYRGAAGADADVRAPGADAYADVRAADAHAHLRPAHAHSGASDHDGTDADADRAGHDAADTAGHQRTCGHRQPVTAQSRLWCRGGQ